MTIKRVAVFGASGRQGQAQVRALLDEGFAVTAVSRNPNLFAAPDLAGADIIPADYADPASLASICRQADAVFFQSPQAERPDRTIAFAGAVAQAADVAGVELFVLNSTMWAPDAPCGQPMYDLALMIENHIAATGVPLIVFRPTVFMDNWLTAFAKPVLVTEHAYRYPHKPELRFSPISLDDVGRFMVAALAKPELIGQRIRIGGPETLSPADVADCLSAAMGVAIRHEYVDPAVFGNHVYDLMGAATGLDRADYVAYFADFYRFNNDAPQQPFLFDVDPVLEIIPLRLERFSDWAMRQDWTSLDDMIGSATG